MKKALIIIILIIVLFVGFLVYMGMFSNIQIEERDMGPYTFAYVEHIGPYSGVGRPMMELNIKMKEAGFNSVHGIGIYYDNPAKTPKDELRSEVGSVIVFDDLDKIDDNRDKFDFATLEVEKYLVAEFPIKNIMSYMLAPMKVYPAFAKYLSDQNLVVPDKGIEYYDMESKKILFMMEIE